MSILNIILLSFTAIAAIDRIFGSRLGLGGEFDRAFQLIGAMALSMIGMIVLAPALGVWLTPFFEAFYALMKIDPSIIPASLFANDMGGASLAIELAKDGSIGAFNAYVVSSMMGCVISFTIPFSLGVTPKEKHKEMFLGFLFGIVTIPIGAFVAGLVLRLPLLALFLDLLPLILLSAIISTGLILAPDLCVRLFSAFGKLMTAMIMIGLLLSIVGYRLGDPILPDLDTLENGAMICFNAAVTLSGAFPLMKVIGKLLDRPMSAFGKRIGINGTAALALIPTLVTSATAFGMMRDMDKKGVVLNAAFAVSAAFVFGSHLAFTMAFDDAYVLSMTVGKLVAGLAAVALALLLYREKPIAQVTYEP